MALVSARGLAKSYGSVRALDGATFEIGEGVTGLLGSNGAGKTTSLKLFMGLIKADGGSVDVPRREPHGVTRVPGSDRLCARARLPAAQRLGRRVPRATSARSAAFPGRPPAFARPTSLGPGRPRLVQVERAERRQARPVDERSATLSPLAHDEREADIEDAMSHTPERYFQRGARG